MNATEKQPTGQEQQSQEQKQKQQWDDFLERVRTTNLPYVVEWVVAWAVVLAFCVKYFVDDWRHQRAMKKLRQHPELWCRSVPLVSVAQNRKRPTSDQALHELIQLLALTSASLASASNIKIVQPAENQKNSAEEESSLGSSVSSFSDHQVMQTLQHSLKARVLATAAMIPAPGAAEPQPSTKNHPLCSQLQRLWPQLLKVPPESSSPQQPYKYELSVILPAYKESFSNLRHILDTAWKHCSQRYKIQVLVVESTDAPQPSLTQALFTNQNWTHSQVLLYNKPVVGGRGGCMNYGALHGAAVGGDHSSSRLWMFLHSDTLLPAMWDEYMVRALPVGGTANIAAFSMGIDQSQRGLAAIGSACRYVYPPGLKAAEWQGRIRSDWCHLPYGDSALTFRASVLQYLGGFCDQPMMEDYEIVSLFRKRAGLFPDTEPLLMLTHAPPILCSPRRWQKFSAHYVALMNWTIVQRYRSGATAEEVSEMYYGEKQQQQQ